MSIIFGGRGGGGGGVSERKEAELLRTIRFLRGVVLAYFTSSNSSIHSSIHYNTGIN